MISRLHLKRVLNTTIRVRLTLWYVLLLAVILALFGVILFLLLDQGLDAQIDDGLKLSAEQGLGALKVDAGKLAVQRIENESELMPLAERGLVVRVVSLDGTSAGVIESLGPFHALQVPADMLATARQGRAGIATVNMPSGTPGSSDSIPLRLYAVPYQEGGRVYGAIVLGQSLKPAQDTLHEFLLILLALVPVTLVCASLGGLFLANRALSPIDRITRAAQQMGAHDLSRRLDLDLPDDEVGRLARTFDMMLARLEEAFHRQRQFTADASHELRTPLAIMKGNIEVTLNHPRRPAEYREVLGDLEEEVDRLTRLVEDLLLLARSSTGRPLLQAEPLDLAGLLQVVVEQVRPMAGAKQLTVDIDAPDELEVEGDPDKLIRLFLNLLDNAIKYTPAGGHITVNAAGDRAGHIRVEVTDTGSGIAPEQIPHIFERFYRTDEARSRSGGGSGLGLALARWITEAHGGTITARSRPGQGTTLVVELPAAERPAALAREAGAHREPAGSRS